MKAEIPVVRLIAVFGTAAVLCVVTSLTFAGDCPGLVG
jgi:hypothetical protein